MSERDKMGEYLVSLVAAAAEVVEERQANLQKRYPDIDHNVDYKSDEDYHEYLMSLGAYEIICKIVMFYNTLDEETADVPIDSLN